MKALKEALKFAEANSLPLIAGVVAGLLLFNLSPGYGYWLHSGNGKIIEFVINEIGMVFFFGLATIEIMVQTREGGSLENVQEAGNPLVATLGGAIGPALIYLAVNWLLGAAIEKGFVIPCATDIAIAWLVAKWVFKDEKHPMVAFILLLAVADDLIGMLLIAGVYGSEGNIAFLGLVITAMALTYGMRKMQVKKNLAYSIPAIMAWFGLHEAGLHASLALLCIIPFMPWGTVHKLEGVIKSPVTWGLFFFGVVNMAVPMGSANEATLIVWVAYILGKPLGIIGGSLLANRIGLKADSRITKFDLLRGAFVCAIGLTVASFVSNIALTGEMQTGAKLGALIVAPTVLIILVLLSKAKKE